MNHKSNFYTHREKTALEKLLRIGDFRNRILLRGSGLAPGTLQLHPPRSDDLLQFVVGGGGDLDLGLTTTGRLPLFLLLSRRFLLFFRRFPIVGLSGLQGLEGVVQELDLQRHQIPEALKTIIKDEVRLHAFSYPFHRDLNLQIHDGRRLFAALLRAVVDEFEELSESAFGRDQEPSFSDGGVNLAEEVLKE